jgi:hypothetical protein
MSRDAERLHFLQLQLSDLQRIEPVIPRSPQNARRIGRTRRNITIVQDILRGLAARVIEDAVRNRPVEVSA